MNYNLEFQKFYRIAEKTKEYYVDIDCDWTVKVDYTKTYTVTVDDLKSGHVPCRCEGPDVDVRDDLSHTAQSLFWKS